ncbi:hypothetical protein AZE42_08909 [Rhizopogon vesiculosus]|uniref:Uncharacterized protein n=1 Tax=Rhizopogon vesiculosus TaxID=180088 RepID=A0A1J8PGW2_9AGAM|nr:hypothetical protein AZE42_08909 [Rhizopogon vesiculosus]
MFARLSTALLFVLLGTVALVAASPDPEPKKHHHHPPEE